MGHVGRGSIGRMGSMDEMNRLMKKYVEYLKMDKDATLGILDTTTKENWKLKGYLFRSVTLNALLIVAIVLVLAV